MKIMFHAHGWEDYLWWQGRDTATLRKINRMIAEASRDPGEGIGKPERLRHLDGCWSRRITQEHRLVYQWDGESLIILQARGHY